MRSIRELVRYITHRFLRVISGATLAALGFFSATAQPASYLTESFDPQRIGAHPLVWAFAQDPNGTLYAANNDGVLIYDGARWRLVPTDRPVRSLAVDGDGTVFVSCVGDVGRLMRDAKQQLAFFSVAKALPKEGKGQGDLRLFSTQAGVVAVGATQAYRFETGKLLPRVTEINLGGSSAGTGQMGDAIYINLDGKGLSVLSGTRLQPVSGGEALAEEQIVALAANGTDQGYVVASNDKLYRLSKGSLERSEMPEFEAFAAKYQSFDLALTAQGKLILGTLRGGVGVSGADGTLSRTLRRRRGLPDDNIYALYVDRENGLWVAHGKGLTRVMPDAPVEQFGLDNGLSGTINSIRPYDGALYVATVQGLFVRRGTAAFEPVTNLANEVWSLEVIGGQLLAAANDGIYQVTGTNAKRAVESSYVGSLAAQAKGDRVGWALTGNGVQPLRKTGGGWALDSVVQIDVPAEDLLALTASSSGDLIIQTSYQGVWRIDASGIVSMGTDTSLGYPTGGAMARVMGSGVVVATRSGVYLAPGFGEPAKRLVINGISASARVDLLAAAGDTLVFSTPAAVHVGVLRDGQLNVISTGWPNLVPGKAQVAYLSRERLYLGVQDNVYVMPRVSETPAREMTPLLIEVVEAGRDTVLRADAWWRGLSQGSTGAELPSLELKPDWNSLRFRFALPSLEQAQANRYQTRLEGLDTTWSDWRPEAERQFAGLSPGSYTFSVRGRDAVGRISQSASVSFSIATPVYLSWWAISLYVIATLLIMFLFARFYARRAELRAIELDQIVQDRTREVKLQKTQIETQVVELNQKNTELDRTLSELHVKNAELDTKNTQLDAKNTELDGALKQLSRKNSELDTALRELKTTQDQLVQQEKMASLGQLVAGVAHEINTPVGIGVTAASKLELRTKEIAAKLKDGQVRKSDFESYMSFAVEGCDMILKNLNRAAELIQSFKRVAVDQGADDVRSINLYEYLHEVIVSVSPSIKKSKVNVALAGDTALDLYTSPSSLSQIVINLIMNSLTHAFDNEQEGVIRVGFERHDGQLKLTVADNGKGIPADVLPKIFDPFFTTNRSKGGSGLGLHIVYNLVAQNLKGTLDVTSEVGKGTTFTITMPHTTS